MMVDEAAVQGLEVPPMPVASQQRLKEMLSFCTPRNPVDITAQVFHAPHLVGPFLDAMLDEGRYAAIVIFFTYAASVEFMAKRTLDALAGVRERHPDRLIVMAMVGSDEAVARYEALNVPVFEDPVRAVRTVSALARVREGLAAEPGAGAKSDARSPGMSYTGGRLDEHEALQMLGSWGIPVAEARVASNAAEAARAAMAIGTPVAMKILSPDIEHKTEAGGVALDVASENAAQEHDALVARATTHDANAEIRGTLVAPMASGVECILGMRRDPMFGPVVMVGTGGVLAEIVNDVSFRRAPIDHEEAKRMIGDLSVSRVLDGVRGRPRCDIDALAGAVAALSRFAAAHADKVASVDVNPFVVLPEGEGGLALDALIVERTVR